MSQEKHEEKGDPPAPLALDPDLAEIAKLLPHNAQELQRARNAKSEITTAELTLKQAQDELTRAQAYQRDCARAGGREHEDAKKETVVAETWVRQATSQLGELQQAYQQKFGHLESKPQRKKRTPPPAGPPSKTKPKGKKKGGPKRNWRRFPYDS